MKKLFVFVSLILFNSIVLTQEKQFFKETELNDFIESGGEIYQIKDSVYKVLYPSGNVKIFSFREKDKTYSNSNIVDSLVINVFLLDTLEYADKFIYWNQANVTSGAYQPILVDDLNLNGYPELYGYSGRRPNFGFAGPVNVLELTSSGTYNNLFSYDSTILVKAIGDIRRDGKKSIYFHSVPDFTQSGIVYTSESINSIPTIFDYVFYYNVPGIGFQINNMTFGDFNNNGKTNCAFICWDSIGKFIIGEFDSVQNNFETIFNYDTIGVNLEGFAINDFDEDGYDEIIFNYDDLGLFVVESNKEKFEIVHRDILPLDYPWLHTVTNDIDGNGKKEFWFGSVDYLYWTGTTLVGYEAIADNDYKPIYKIYLQNLFTQLGTMHLNSEDIDGDNKEELIVSVQNQIIILKFSGLPNNHNYEVFYYKNNDGSFSQNRFYPCSFYDVNSDGFKDLIIPTSNYITYIYLQNTSGNYLNEPEIKNDDYHLFQNYPNPFNPVTIIIFSIPKSDIVKIRVYDVLGKEIQTLLNEYKTTGSYEVEFDASSLPSGVYFYRMISGSYSKTK